MQWEPNHDSNSIDVAAVTLAFSERLPDVAWRKAIREAESAAKAAGLVDRNVVNSIQITIGVPMDGLNQAPAPEEAIVFGLPKVVALGGGGFQKMLVESLTVARNTLTYQTTSYTRWEAFFERAKLLIRPPLRSALHAVRPANLRLEYKDVFRFAGEGPSTAEDLLRRESDLFASHVLRNQGLWHSHTGFIEKAKDCESRLVQINIDSNDAKRLTDTKLCRIIGIMTAVQNNFSNEASDAVESEDSLATEQLAMLDSMHTRANDVLKQLLGETALKRIGMIK